MSPGGHGARRTRYKLKMQTSNRNERREANSCFATRWAVPVFGLIWKTQPSTEDRKRVLPEGPGCGSPLVAVQGAWGEEGIAFCRLSLGYADGNRVSGGLRAKRCARGVNSDDTPRRLWGAPGGLTLDARGPPTGHWPRQSP